MLLVVILGLEGQKGSKKGRAAAIVQGVMHLTWVREAKRDTETGNPQPHWQPSFSQSYKPIPLLSLWECLG